MSRRQGSGRGSVCLKGKIPAWYGEWREYREDSEKPRHRCKFLGWASQMTKPEARAALDRLLHVDNALDPFPPEHRSVQEGGLNAAYAEALVAADLLRRGHEVYRPFNNYCRHDFLAIKDGATKRIEVKLTKVTDDGFACVDLSRKFGQFDILAIVGRSGTITYQNHDEAFRPGRKREV